jgi:hypothetical protein
MIETAMAPRRTLRFRTLDDLDTELVRIEEAHRAGRLSHTGNWSPGTILGHLAAWIEYGWTGYPPNLRVPWFVRPLLRLRKKKFLRSPLPGGFRIPGVEGGTLGTEPMEFDAGMARFRDAVQPLRRGQAPPHPSPAFGRFDNPQATQAALRHAELHLGFLNY